jgi:hypothetical protein
MATCVRTDPPASSGHYIAASAFIDNGATDFRTRPYSRCCVAASPYFQNSMLRCVILLNQLILIALLHSKTAAKILQERLNGRGRHRKMLRSIAAAFSTYRREK